MIVGTDWVRGLFKAPPLLLALTMSSCFVTNVSCPQLITYSKAFQAEAATERELVDKYAPKSAELIDDYRKTRDAIRQCPGRAVVK